MENLNHYISHKNETCKNEKMPLIEAYFDDLEGNLIEKILQHKEGIIFGCVAWLTSEKILAALAQCNNVQIIVQKEDFLRPDMDSNFNWNSKIRSMYSKLQFNFRTFQLKDPMCEYSIGMGQNLSPIMCVGNHNSSKNPAFPRSHHKFLVFCDNKGEFKKHDARISYKPTAVWTGSFNLTKNATHSFENAIYIEDKSGKNKIINAYLNEHHQIFTISEHLDWKNDWVTPEYRLGT